jgi:hypothetical protein
MAQAVRRRPVSAVTSVQSQVSPHEICGGQSGAGKDLCPILRFFEDKQAMPGNLKKSMLFSKIGAKWIEHTSLSL